MCECTLHCLPSLYVWNLMVKMIVCESSPIKQINHYEKLFVTIEKSYDVTNMWTQSSQVSVIFADKGNGQGSVFEWIRSLTEYMVKRVYSQERHCASLVCQMKCNIFFTVSLHNNGLV